MVLVEEAISLPHNPLVLGSSPSCPTFSTIPPQQSCSFCASVTHSCFYTNFTHLTGVDRHQPAQIYLVSYPLSNSFLFKSRSLFFSSEIYQLFIQVRKKCVKLCLYISHTVVCERFSYQKQRIYNPLLVVLNM